MTNRIFLLFLLITGCGDSGSSNTTGGSHPDLAKFSDLATFSPDMTINNPMNPAGLGPAPVEIGASTNLAAAGSYVLLAKTGITNVTASAITGGNLGLSPAAASFITGFGRDLEWSPIRRTSTRLQPRW
jgi:hypothetical protein